MMSIVTMRQGIKHNIKENKSYYLTMTVVGWVDLFSRKSQRDLFISSLKYCIQEKGLNVYAYCLMTNHIHLIVNCNEPYNLRDTIRDLKKFTAKAAIKELINGKESRREWMIEIFKKEGELDPKNKTVKVWQSGNHAIELYSEKFTWEKVNYIHRNPVEAGLVKNPDQWLYSSARNYAERVDLNFGRSDLYTAMVDYGVSGDPGYNSAGLQTQRSGCWEREKKSKIA